MEIDLSDNLDIMKDELLEYCDNLEKILLKFEEGHYNEESIEDTKRYFHSVKGLLGFLGSNFDVIRDLIHQSEDLLGSELKQNGKLTAETIQRFLTLVDCLKVSANSLSMELSVSFIRQTFSALLEDYSGLKLDEEYELLIHFGGESSMRGTRALASLNVVKRFTTIKESKPSRTDLMDDNTTFDVLQIYLISKINEEELKEKFAALPGIKSYTLKNLAAVSVVEEAEEISPSLSTNIDYSIKTADMVKINYILEDMIGLDRFLQTLDPVILGQEEKNSINSFKRNLFDIQETLYSTRQLPMKVILDPLPRIVRDLSKREGKEIQFFVSGEDIRLDRSLLQKLSDPLIVILQNSIVHGIESGTERVEAGKSKSGIIRLEISEGAGETAIRIFDNGRGIDYENIWSIALERSLVQGEFNENRARQLLFSSEFSTRDSATTSAGRGMGLYQVSKLLQDVNGKINITTKLGQSSTFELIFPVQNNLASIILVMVNNQRFAFPETHVQRIIKADKIEMDLKEPVSIARIGGGEIKIVNIGKIMTENYDQDNNGAVIVWNNGLLEVGFYVDEIVTFEEMVINYNDPLSEINPLISGTSSISGNVVYLLNPHSFVEA